MKPPTRSEWDIVNYPPILSNVAGKLPIFVEVYSFENYLRRDDFPASHVWLAEAISIDIHLLRIGFQESSFLDTIAMIKEDDIYL